MTTTIKINPEVWTFPDPNYKVHAAYYPNIPDDLRIFGASTFFFDYQNAYEEAWKSFVDFNPGTSFSKILPTNSNPSCYHESAKWTMIYDSWKRYFQMTKSKPELLIMPDQYYKILRVGGMIDENKYYGIIKHLGRPDPFGAARWAARSLSDKTNRMTSFAHYPPMQQTGLFDEKIVFNPADPQSTIKYYGATNPKFLQMLARNKIVKLSELVRPNGYGFIFDYRSIGINEYFELKMSQNRDKWFTEQFLKSVAFRDGNTPDGKERWFIDEDNVPTPEIMARQFYIRDEWISLMLKTGYIPSQADIIDRNGMIVPCPYLGKAYTAYVTSRNISFWENFELIFGALLGVGMFATGVYESISTGNFGVLVKTTADIVVNSIKRVLPQASKYLDAAMVLAIGPILRKKLPINDSISETSNFLINISNAQIQAYGASFNREDFEFGVSNSMKNFHDNTTEKQREIISMISQAMQPEESDIVNQSANAEEASNIIIKKAKSSNDLLLGAGLISGALLLKKLLK